jgi:hypothetical protein
MNTPLGFSKPCQQVKMNFTAGNMPIQTFLDRQKVGTALMS